MFLIFTKASGETVEIELSDQPLSFGRSQEADIVINDEKASRMHCGIRYENGTYILRDLKSKNGTFVNDQAVEMVELQPGDRIRIGAIVLRVEEEAPTGQDTAVHEVEEEMADGKGYGTILKEIVGTVDDSDSRPQA